MGHVCTVNMLSVEMFDLSMSHSYKSCTQLPMHLLHCLHQAFYCIHVDQCFTFILLLIWEAFRHLCQKTSYAITFVLLLCHSFSLANRMRGSVFSPRHAALIRTSFLWVKRFSLWLPQHRPLTLFLLFLSTVVFLWDFQEEYYARSNLKVDLKVVFSYICVF